MARAERVLARLDPVDRATGQATDGVRIDETSVEAIGRAEARRARLGHLALWVIAVLLAIYFFV